MVRQAATDAGAEDAKACLGIVPFGSLMGQERQAK